MKKLPISDEELAELYLNQKFSARTISKRIGVGKNTVFFWLQKLKLTRKGRYDELIGQKFGKLTVVSLEERTIGSRAYPWFNCICDCGAKRAIRATVVKNGYSKSCGCNLKILPFHEGIRGDFFRQIERSGKNRGHKFNITIEDAWNLYLRQGGKCALSGVPILLCHRRSDITASLDRINSHKGYTIDNIQWVHKDVNYMKRVLSEEIFFSWVKKIYEFRGL